MLLHRTEEQELTAGATQQAGLPELETKVLSGGQGLGIIQFPFELCRPTR